MVAYRLPIWSKTQSSCNGLAEAKRLDVPPAVEFYVDLVKVSKAVSRWGMLFGLFRASA
jgi:hypothetical protein